MHDPSDVPPYALIRLLSLISTFVFTLGCTGADPDVPVHVAGGKVEGKVGAFVYRIVSNPQIGEGHLLWACVLVRELVQPIPVQPQHGGAVSRLAVEPTPIGNFIRVPIVNGKPLLPMPSPSPTVSP